MTEHTDRCLLCNELANDYGLVLLFVGQRHLYYGCQFCEVAYERIKEEEDDQREEREENS